MEGDRFGQLSDDVFDILAVGGQRLIRRRLDAGQLCRGDDADRFADDIHGQLIEGCITAFQLKVGRIDDLVGAGHTIRVSEGAGDAHFVAIKESHQGKGQRVVGGNVRRAVEHLGCRAGQLGICEGRFQRERVGDGGLVGNIRIAGELDRQCQILAGLECLDGRIVEEEIAGALQAHAFAQLIAFIVVQRDLMDLGVDEINQIAVLLQHFDRAVNNDEVAVHVGRDVRLSGHDRLGRLDGEAAQNEGLIEERVCEEVVALINEQADEVLARIGRGYIGVRTVAGREIVRREHAHAAGTACTVYACLLSMAVVDRVLRRCQDEVRCGGLGLLHAGCLVGNRAGVVAVRGEGGQVADVGDAAPRAGNGPQAESHGGFGRLRGAVEGHFGKRADGRAGDIHGMDGERRFSRYALIGQRGGVHAHVGAAVLAEIVCSGQHGEGIRRVLLNGHDLGMTVVGEVLGIRQRNGGRAVGHDAAHVGTGGGNDVAAGREGPCVLVPNYDLAATVVAVERAIRYGFAVAVFKRPADELISHRQRGFLCTAAVGGADNQSVAGILGQVDRIVAD